MPWKASDGTVRNRKSLSFSVVMVGDVDALVICRTPSRLVIDVATGMVTPEDSAPTMALTPSTLTSFWAASTPACGLVWVSATTISTLPPPALISSAASWMPLRSASP